MSELSLRLTANLTHLSLIGPACLGIIHWHTGSITASDVRPGSPSREVVRVSYQMKAVQRLAR